MESGGIKQECLSLIELLKNWDFKRFFEKPFPDELSQIILDYMRTRDVSTKFLSILESLMEIS